MVYEYYPPPPAPPLYICIIVYRSFKFQIIRTDDIFSLTLCHSTHPWWEPTGHRMYISRIPSSQFAPVLCTNSYGQISSLMRLAYRRQELCFLSQRTPWFSTENSGLVPNNNQFNILSIPNYRVYRVFTVQNINNKRTLKNSENRTWHRGD